MCKAMQLLMASIHNISRMVWSFSRLWAVIGVVESMNESSIVTSMFWLLYNDRFISIR